MKLDDRNWDVSYDIRNAITKWLESNNPLPFLVMVAKLDEMVRYDFEYGSKPDYYEQDTRRWFAKAIRFHGRFFMDLEIFLAMNPGWLEDRDS